MKCMLMLAMLDLSVRDGHQRRAAKAAQIASMAPNVEAP